MKDKVSYVLLAGLLVGAPRLAQAQLFYVGVRGGAAIPTGTFSETSSVSGDAFFSAATPGLGYGVDAGIGAGLLGLYASADRIQFECDKDLCDERGKYKLSGVSAGVRLGVPLFPLIKPWVKAGVVVNDITGTLSGGAAATRIETVRRPGYELGAGIDIPIAGIFSVTPQGRYVRQRLKYRLEPAGAAAGPRDVNYYTFDIAFRLRSPI